MNASLHAATSVRPLRALWRRRLSMWADNERVLGYLLVGPVVLLLLCLVGYPFVVAVGYALSDRTLSDPGEFIGLENFYYLFDNQIYRQTMRNTLIFTAGSVTMRLVFGVGLALILNEAFRFQRLVRAAVMLPWIVPTVLGAMAWLWMFNPNFSVINWALEHSGLMAQGPNWLTDPNLALFSVTLVNAWRGTPFVAITVLAGLQTIPRELYDASAIDGAGKFQRFRHITLPLLMPFIVVALIIRCIDALKAFDTIYVITQGGPGSASETINIFLYLQAFAFYNIGYASAVVVVFFVIIVMLSLLLLYMRQRAKWQ